MVSGRSMRLWRARRERDCMKDLLEEAGQSWREMEAGRGFPSVWRAGPVLSRAHRESGTVRFHGFLVLVPNLLPSPWESSVIKH